ncbi:hypothetical protein PIB30_009655 [Stylosanthes scabra]|uniref:Uncharacterized protein n=1 Tax=Stylosanthes scabra TaxID=79078 RepID=A0ABU6T5Q9_9FABA|nr:hypothetical protein [Stylosanthes scabra]
MRTHPNERERGSRKDAWCVRIGPMRTYSVRIGRASRAYKRTPSPSHLSFSSLISQVSPNLRKAKTYQAPTRFSRSLAALSARQAKDEVGPSNAAPHNDEVIEISSDSDSEQIPEYVPGEGAGIEEEEKVPKYVPGEGAIIEVLQPLNQEEPEDIPYDGPVQDPEDKPMEDEEEYPEEEQENEEEDVPNLQPGIPDYDEYFHDYFKLGPPPSPDSSTGSPSSSDDQ